MALFGAPLAHSPSLAVAYRSLGLVFLRRGGLMQAIPPLERAVELCRVIPVRALFDVATAHLGYAYALAGRLHVARALESGLVRHADEVPQYATPEGRVKLAAAWLVERSGFARGGRHGAFGISTRHALALVHHGGGTTAELLALADRIGDRVHARFGIDLQMEAVRVG